MLHPCAFFTAGASFALTPDASLMLVSLPCSERENTLFYETLADLPLLVPYLLNP